VAITGASGQLGRALLALGGETWEIDALSSTEVDLRNWRALRDRLARFAPDLVVHAAAATDVDRCEREPDWAYAINALGTRHVARAAALVNAELVYVSTNYVFDGAQDAPYHEFSAPRPISVYGASKLAGELEARSATPRCFIVRTSWLYAAEGRNFVNTMRRLMATQPSLRVVADQTGNPTYAADLAAALALVVERAPYGTYHSVNAGVTSWHGWASEIARLDGHSSDTIVPIPAADYQRAATPPPNGALVSLALPGLGIELPDWRDALQRCLHA
jgi:dTDP-4-dehydrorhamnose reductase